MSSKLVICAIFFFCGVISVASLKVDSPGVCVVTKQVRKTRYTSVTFVKWCRGRRCTAVKKKPIVYTKAERQTVCCKGWVYEATSDSCVPSCSTGCYGGRCVAPDQCVCDPPTILDPQHNNTCVTPICTPDQPSLCINSECQNNTCICKPGYERYNTTHCYHCEPDYQIDEDFTCRLHCDPGYAVNGNQCEPVCYTCVNAKCVQPNVCQCYEGYHGFGDVCEPVCNCTGRCIAPNVCECPEGYRNISGQCEPICDGCVNGVCTAPNVCTCYEGFAKNTKGECYDCEKSCTNCDDAGNCLDNCTAM
ncbi:unnamed protein product [Colias eurytheme]|nr:unnamed protein product [Colias eurytheme]